MSAEHCRDEERYADILDRSAGSLQTPRLLFRSGIGPKDMITLVQGNTDAAPNLPDEADWIDLPVGENVSDNPSVNVSCQIHLSFAFSPTDFYSACLHSSRCRLL